MARFSYIAIDHKKKTVKGTVTAENSYAARKHLRAKGMHPTTVKELSASQEAFSLASLFKKSAKNQVVEFTKQLSTMLNADIKLTEALQVLIMQVTDVHLKNAITDIRDRVVTGESFADGLGEYDNYFDLIYISMIRVGEVTGTLPKSLSIMAGFMEKRQRIESKMATVMIYPVILIVLCLGAVLFLTIKVIPVIAEQIEKTGQELPWITRFLVGVSNVFTSWYLLVIIAATAMIIYSIRKFFRSDKGARLRDKFLLWLPVFGPLVKQRIVARFASTLSTLLGSGLVMAESLRVVSEVIGNVPMSQAVKKARERILAGADIATPLRDSGLISPAIAHMVTVGEKSGELETMLKNISDNLEESGDIVIERLSAALEPIIIIITAAIVAVIAYATLLPIIKFSVQQF